MKFHSPEKRSDRNSGVWKVKVPRSQGAAVMLCQSIRKPPQGSWLPSPMARDKPRLRGLLRSIADRAETVNGANCRGNCRGLSTFQPFNFSTFQPLNCRWVCPLLVCPIRMLNYFINYPIAIAIGKGNLVDVSPDRRTLNLDVLHSLGIATSKDFGPNM